MGLWDKAKGYGRSALDAYRKYTPAGQALGYAMGKDDRLDNAEGRYPMQERGAYNLPGYKGRSQELSDFASSRGGGQFMQQQGELGNMLMGQARGENSFAAEKMRQDLGRLQAQQQGMAAGARPSQSAMASRLAMQNTGQLGADMAGQSQLAQIAERTAAAQSAGNVLGQGRQQDISAYLGAQNLGLQNAIGQQQGTFQYGQEQANRFNAAMQQPTQGERMFGMIKGVGESFISDVQAKKNIVPLGAPPPGVWINPNLSPEEQRRERARMAEDRAAHFGVQVSPTLDPEERARAQERHVTDIADRFVQSPPPAYSYDYKSGRGPKGRQVGMMAQDVEQVAPDAVEDTSRGKSIRVDRMVPRLMAAYSMLKRRLDQMQPAAPPQDISGIESQARAMGMGRQVDEYYRNRR